MPLTGHLSEFFRNLLIIFQGSGRGMYFSPVLEDSLPFCAVIAVRLLVISFIYVSLLLSPPLCLCILHSTHLLLIHATYRCCGYPGRAATALHVCIYPCLREGSTLSTWHDKGPQRERERKKNFKQNIFLEKGLQPAFRTKYSLVFNSKLVPLEGIFIKGKSNFGIHWELQKDN